MRLSNNQLEELYLEDSIILEDGTTLEVVEEGEWVDEGKFVTLSYIFTDGVRFFEAHIARSGSHFTGYTFDSEVMPQMEDCVEVVEKEVLVRQWTPKNEGDE